MQEHCFVSSFSWENVKTDKNITRNNGYTKFGGMTKDSAEKQKNTWQIGSH